MKTFISHLVDAVRAVVLKMESEAFEDHIYMTHDTAAHLASFDPNFTISENGKTYFMGYEVKIINSNMIIMGKDVKIYGCKD